MAVKDHPYYKQISQRKNVILLGDSLGDPGMTEGMECDTVIRIGFLNSDTDKYLKDYEKAYDALILDDGPMDYVNELIEDVLSSE